MNNKKIAILFLMVFILMPVASAQMAIIKDTTSSALQGVSTFLGGIKSSAEKTKEKIKDLREVAPEFEFTSLNAKKDASGEVRIEGNIDQAQVVEFYAKLPQSTAPVYLGNGVQDGTNWRFDWNTRQNPNGQYKIFAKVKNEAKEYLSKEASVNVNNLIESGKEKAQQIEKKIEEAKEEVNRQENEIIAKKEEAKSDFAQKLQEKTNEVKKIVNLESKKDASAELQKKMEESKKDVSEAIEKFSLEAQNEQKISKELQEKNLEKQRLEEEMRKTIEEIRLAEEARKKIQRDKDQAKEKAVEVIVDSKKSVLENYKKQTSEAQKAVDEFNALLAKIKENKEKAREQVIESTRAVISTAEKTATDAQRGQTNSVKAQLEQSARDGLMGLEKEVKQKEEAKINKQQTLANDSDGDGLSDEEEIRLKTDPFNPDTDNDGYLDGTEVALGYNPLNPSPAGKIVYSDPREVGVIERDIYAVESVRQAQNEKGEKVIKIQGRALPNSFVTVYIFSSPIVMVTKTDENGNWIIDLDKNLPDGTHEVYIALTDNYGQIAARSEVFAFTKVGDRVAAITLSSLAGGGEEIAVGIFKNNAYLVVGLIIVLSMIVSLVIIGIFSRRKAS